jgi:hypothetical protein
LEEGIASPRGSIGVALKFLSANQQRANIAGGIRGRHRMCLLWLHVIAPSKFGLRNRNDKGVALDTCGG